MDLNSFHLNGLRAVETVARTGSLQKAAAELGVSTSAVSQQVGRTEKQLGRPVFSRTAGGLVPTEFGAIFTARLSAGFGELARAIACAGDDTSNTLIISVAPAFASRWLVQRLGRFHALNPQIRLRIDASTALVDLTHSDVHAAVRMGNGHWPGTRTELLLAQEVFPVCSPKLAERLRTPADIADHPVIADESTMISWSAWLRKAGAGEVELRTAGPSFTDPILGIDAAIAGQGIALAWQLLVADALADGRLVAPFGIKSASGLGYYLVTAAAGRESRKVAAFRRWVRDEIAATMSVGLIDEPPAAAE
jgi:LysR family transcriptional regulator, glycine cleavage system transcriptional activator